MSLSHINPENQQPRMVHVGEKAITRRTARAEAVVRLTPAIMEQLDGDRDELVTPKGPVFQTAIIAGTQAAKRTWELIPFCHPLLVEGIDIAIRSGEDCRVHIDCTVKITGKTGVEMEALTGASVAALTVYDMCKAMSQEIEIERVRLLEKSGGKTDYEADS